MSNSRSNDSLSTSFKQFVKSFARQDSNAAVGLRDVCGLFWSYRNVAKKTVASLINNPEKLTEAITQSITQHLELINADPESPTTDKHQLKDRRFRHKHWQDKPFFKFLAQSYLINAQLLSELFDNLEDLDEKTQQQLKFLENIFINMAAPSNHFLSNPEIQRLTQQQKAKNLVSASKLWLEDMSTWHGYINLTKSRLDGFKLGENIACTEGAVIFENHLMELIQYSPKTKTVYQTPLLIITSWINKYYILDLEQKNSLVKWLVAQGYTVYMISWVNPTHAAQCKHFTDYIIDGIIQATNIIREQTQTDKIHAVGYCMGGTLLASADAYFATQASNPFLSTSYLASLIDFSEPGCLGNYAAPEQIAWYKKTMRQSGYLAARKMLTAFNLTNTEDFIWPYFINRYLRGKTVNINHSSFYWSQDMTNIPGPLFLFHMSTLLKDNLLTDGKSVTVDNTALNFSSITTPSYFLATEDDYISPWQGVFKSTQVTSGNNTYVLTASDHVQGILNTPDKHKLHYFTNEKSYLTADKWLKAADKHLGSWWPHWHDWLQKQDHQKTLARSLDTKNILRPAPGQYVLESIFSDHGNHT